MLRESSDTPPFSFESTRAGSWAGCPSSNDRTPESAMRPPVAKAKPPTPPITARPNMIKNRMFTERLSKIRSEANTHGTVEKPLIGVHAKSDGQEVARSVTP
jgi:hypothetical protein